MTSSVQDMAVVIPVHNEEAHLPRALAGVAAAVARLHLLQPQAGVRVLVVLDSCTDGSAAIAADYAARTSWLSTLTVGFRSVGRSRRAGIWAVLGAAADNTPDAAAGLWLANTDADSRVPKNWLVAQAAMAAEGADAVLGSVEVDPVGTAPELLRSWQLQHRFRENHPHVYGANFGIRASAYLAAGGFRGITAMRTASWRSGCGIWISPSGLPIPSACSPQAGPAHASHRDSAPTSRG
jgi:glycosyltransferase involved in cell wall biosynthesis